MTTLAHIVLLTEKEIRDARRSKWFVLISGVFAVLTLGLSWLGMSGMGNLGITGFGRTTASLLNLVLLIVPLMGLLLGTISLSSEKEQGTLRTLMAQPLVPMEIFYGKFMGNVVALLTTLSLGFAISGFMIAWRGGMLDLGAYLTLVLFTFLLGVIFLAIGFCISVYVQRTINAIAFAIFTWFLFLFMSDFALMGSTLAFKLSAQQLLWFSFLNPCQIFKITLLATMHKDIEVLGPVGIYAVDLLGNNFFMLMAFILFIWLLVPLVTAALLFKRQCVR